MNKFEFHWDNGIEEKMTTMHSSFIYLFIYLFLGFWTQGLIRGSFLI